MRNLYQKVNIITKQKSLIVYMALKPKRKRILREVESNVESSLLYPKISLGQRKLLPNYRLQSKSPKRCEIRKMIVKFTPKRQFGKDLLTEAIELLSLIGCISPRFVQFFREGNA